MTEPYATHTNVLTQLGKTCAHIKRVLELGCGRASTPLFLNKDAFPNLTYLASYEDDSAWAKIMLDEIKDDRLEMRLVPEPIEDSLRGKDLSGFDLILIDNAVSCSVRANTIRFILEESGYHGIVVLHDWNSPEHQQASGAAKVRLLYLDEHPSTAVFLQ